MQTRRDTKQELLEAKVETSALIGLVLNLTGIGDDRPVWSRFANSWHDAMDRFEEAGLASNDARLMAVEALIRSGWSYRSMHELFRDFV